MTQSHRKPQPIQPTENHDLFRELDVEMWFAKRLEEQGYHVFMGVTDGALRRERIRQAILDRRCEITIIGKLASGKPETYQQAFERFYGQPLTAKRKGKAT